MICYRKHSVRNADIRAADHTPPQLSMVQRRSTSAHRVATTRFAALPACRSACPVDAIVGAHQFMHTVIVSECTGCELCVAPCPVDCITMRPVS
jgi:electron transport complex protein RnfB